MELKRVIGGKRNVETPRKIIWERIASITQKQRVVAEWTHGNSNLGQVVKILQDRDLEPTIQYNFARHGTINF